MIHPPPYFHPLPKSRGHPRLDLDEQGSKTPWPRTPPPSHLRPLEDVQVCELLELPHALSVCLHDLLVIEQHPPLSVRPDVRDVVPRVDGRALMRDKRLETEPRGEL
ncbi:hypothetical protein GSI_07933 [Ganoderma sinense ZZ0214-1]|uniref:Uncharacterized protein n=1 Tax=Ganoderma sinense ZZ0214-1 TaxID=1077348 RepID=A0A2G8S8D6_9APHY|nr:hypothetical protein GSI_07933 [Ganoderma sinense ZZ0214-1]